MLRVCSRPLFEWLHEFMPYLCTASPAGSLPSIKDYKDRVRKAHQQQFEQPVFVEDEAPVGTVLEEDNPPTIATEPDSPESQRSVNFAAQAAGAVVLSKNNEAKGSKHLLNDDDDKYFMSPCSEPTFVVIGLSEDCIVQQVILSNYERYSSTVKDFLVLGSQSYPTKEWMVLGNFTAADVQGEQTFDMQARKVWVRYIKLQWRSHYRDEYYCTMTQVAVHGQTIMQDLHEVVSPPVADQIEPPAAPTPAPPPPEPSPSDAPLPADAASGAGQGEAVTDQQQENANSPAATPPASSEVASTPPSPTPHTQADTPPSSSAAPASSQTQEQPHNSTSIRCVPPHSTWSEHFLSLAATAASPSPQLPTIQAEPSEATSSPRPQASHSASHLHPASVDLVCKRLRSSWRDHFMRLAGPSTHPQPTQHLHQGNHSRKHRQPSREAGHQRAAWPVFWVSCARGDPAKKRQWQSCERRHGHPLLASPLQTHAQATQLAISSLNATLVRDLSSNLSAPHGRPEANHTASSPAPPAPQLNTTASQTPPTQQDSSDTGVTPTLSDESAPLAVESPAASPSSTPTGSVQQPSTSPEPAASESALPSAEHNEAVPSSSASGTPASSPAPVKVPSTSKGSPAQTLFKQLRSQVQDLELQQHALDAYLEDFRSAYDQLMGEVQGRLGNTTAALGLLQSAVHELSGIVPGLVDQLQAHNSSIVDLQASLLLAQKHLPQAATTELPHAMHDTASAASAAETMEFYALLVLLSCALSVLSCATAAFVLCCR